MNVNVIRFLLSRASGRRFFTHFEHFHTIADQTAEAIFVIGVAGCVFTVIPITAYRLLMVLFESKSSNTDSPPQGIHQTSTGHESATWYGREK